MKIEMVTKMSEERFKVIDNNFSMWIVDTTLKEDKHEGAIYSAYDMCRKLNELYEENEKLRQELQGMDELLQSYRKTIKHDAELLADASKNGYLPLLNVEKMIEDRNNCVLNKNAKYPCKAYDECLKTQGTNKPLPCIMNWVMGRPFKNMLRKE